MIPARCGTLAISGIIDPGHNTQSALYANGRFALIRFTSVEWTTADFARCRLRLAFLHDIRWRRVACERSTLPFDVILNRLATAFLVLLRATDFGIRRGR